MYIGKRSTSDRRSCAWCVCVCVWVCAYRVYWRLFNGCKMDSMWRLNVFVCVWLCANEIVLVCITYTNVRTPSHSQKYASTNTHTHTHTLRLKHTHSHMYVVREKCLRFSHSPSTITSVRVYYTSSSHPIFKTLGVCRSMYDAAQHTPPLHSNRAIDHFYHLFILVSFSLSLSRTHAYNVCLLLSALCSGSLFFPFSSNKPTHIPWNATTKDDSYECMRAWLEFKHVFAYVCMTSNSF